MHPPSMSLFLSNFDHRPRERVEFVRRYREGRRKIDDVPDRPHKYAQFNEPAADHVEITDLIQLHDANAAHNAHVLDALQVATPLEPSGEVGRNIRDLLQARLSFEQIERRVRGSAAERIRPVSRPVAQSLTQESPTQS